MKKKKYIQGCKRGVEEGAQIHEVMHGHLQHAG